MKNNIKELEREVRQCVEQMAEHKEDEKEFTKAEREMKIAQARLTAEREALLNESVNASKPVNKQVRLRSIIEEARKGGVNSFRLQREVTSSVLGDKLVNNMESAGLPITINDLLNPLEMDTVYDKVGIAIATNVHGTLVWPCLDTAAEVSVAGETVELEDTDLDFSKITAVPQRVGISIKVSNEAINDAAFDLVGTVTTQIQKSLARVLNKAVIGTEAIGKLAGPFSDGIKNVGAISFAGSTPTYKELLEMKGTVMGKGVQMAGFCYVMNATTYADLEATPITEGDSRMIIEGGKIAGYPVFVTDSAKIADGCVNAGCFGYAALNQHGDMNLIVDPYTAAKQNMVVFTLNADFSLTTLKGEAFCVGTAA